MYSKSNRAKMIKVNPAVDRQDIKQALVEAAGIIRTGGLVAFPTETVYGLGADATNGEAVRKVFLAKGRPCDNPLIVHICSTDALDKVVVDVPRIAKTLMDEFWPGPLTLVMRKSNLIPVEVSAGLSTVGVRMPDHPVALALIEAAGVPIAAPSANISGRPSPTRAEHVWDDLGDKIDMIVDGGPTEVGVESTVLDVTGRVPEVLRPGGVSVEEIEAAIGKVKAPAQVASGADGEGGTLPSPVRPRSPGMKYKHYSPKAEVWLVEGDPDEIRRDLSSIVKAFADRGRKVGLLVSYETARDLSGCIPGGFSMRVTGNRADLETIAANLFASLRQLDEQGVDVILAECYSEVGIGRAVMNRLLRASGGRVIHAARWSAEGAFGLQREHLQE